MEIKKTYRKLRIAILSASICLAIPLSINACNSDRFNEENPKTYGKCRVWTQIGNFTNAQSHHLRCWQATNNIAIRQWAPKKLQLWLGEGVMQHNEMATSKYEIPIPIKLKIDKGKIIKKNAQWENSEYGYYVYIDDTKLALSVMDELENAQKVTIQVGEKSGEITLNGAKDGVRDFKQRINYP